MAVRMRVARSRNQRQRNPASLPGRMPAPSKRLERNVKHLRCSRHQGDPITEFSLTYQQCMCLRCATAQHDNFSDFVPVSQCVSEKREEANTLFDDIADFAKIARGYRRDRHKFVENIKEAERHIKATLKKVKNGLIRHIDMLESKLIKSLTNIVVSEKKSAKDVLTELHNLEEQMANIREHVDEILQRGDDVEVVTTVVESKETFESLRSDFVFPDDKISQKSLQFKLSPALAEFFDRVTDLGEVSLQTAASSFGSPELKFIGTTSPSVADSYAESKLTISEYSGAITMSGTAMSHLTSKELFHRENGGVTMRRPMTSEMGHNSTPANQLGAEASVIFSAEHNGPCNLIGVAALDFGWVVVCDSKHKCIQLVNRKSEILDDLVFHYKPCSITRMSNSSFAVSFGHKDFISLFNINNRHFSHVRDIRIGGKGGNYNMAFSRNKFAVCRKGEIRLISSDDGSLLDTIPIATAFPKLVMSDAGSKIYMADVSASKVVCMTNLGHVVWEFVRGHMQPTGIALDLNQLFVSGASGRVFILSTYGDLIRDIMCGGLLRAVSVDPRSGKLVLTQESKDKTRSRTVKILSV